MYGCKTSSDFHLPRDLREIRDERKPDTGAVGPCCAHCVEVKPVQPAMYRGRQVLLCEGCRKTLGDEPQRGRR